MNCIFCDIIERKEKSEILFESENIISFLDIRPVNFGHALVIPKKHYESFLTIPEEDLEELIKTTQHLSKSVMEGLNADGFNLIVNSGEAAGQTVFHFHFHIIPRFKNDFKFKPNFKIYLKGKKQEYADKIRESIKKG